MLKIEEIKKQRKNQLKAIMDSKTTLILRLTRPLELIDPRTKNDSDKTQDICMPYLGNGYV